MPQYFLLKTEPTAYSFADLQRDKATVWDGVHNPVALRNLASMKTGDLLIVYETGEHKSAIGTATVVSVDLADAKNPQMELKAGTALANSTNGPLPRLPSVIPEATISSSAVDAGEYPPLT